MKWIGRLPRLKAQNIYWTRTCCSGNPPRSHLRRGQSRLKFSQLPSYWFHLTKPKGYFTFRSSGKRLLRFAKRHFDAPQNGTTPKSIKTWKAYDQQQNDDGRNCRKPRFFPRSSGEKRPRRNFARAGGGRNGSGCAHS